LAEIRELTWANINKSRLITIEKRLVKLINNPIDQTALAYWVHLNKKMILYSRCTKHQAPMFLNGVMTNWVKRAEIKQAHYFLLCANTFACLLLIMVARSKNCCGLHMGQQFLPKSTLKILKFLSKLPGFEAIG